MMNHITRRTFLKRTGQSALMTGLVANGLFRLGATEPKPRKMTIDLVCGNLGIQASQLEAVDLAARHGFESVGADGGYLASLDASRAADLKSTLQGKGLVFGAAGLPVEFRGDDARFAESMKKLPGLIAGLQRAGVDRITTWLNPGSNKLTFVQNFRQHAQRLRQVAAVAGDGGVRLGLEYVAPKTSWVNQRYPFIHTFAEMKDLLTEINATNVGFVLDSWHWWHAGDSAADILTLQGREVIAVDLNDAPVGTPKDQLMDNHRELPCATGVIDVGAFLSALNQIGYDGPVRAEPFNQQVNHMSKDDACAAAAASLKKAFALIT
jgi:sugar phosphate isomerase/epimerase